MRISNWNNNQIIENADLQPLTENLPEHDFCIRGNGRSYGDASLYPSMVSTLENKSVLKIVQDVLIVSSGFLLRDVLQFCFDNSFLFPVIPGTSYVTIGGMVAADVHGKNHKTKGTLGNWIEKLDVRNEENQIVCCSLTEHQDVFRATIGGMGQTGIIETVHIRLEKWKQSDLKQNVQAQFSLSEILRALQKSESDFQVAWWDFLNPQKAMIFEYDWQKSSGDSSFKIAKPIFNFPRIPFSLLSKGLMRFYNRWYFKKNLEKNGQIVDLMDCFFPLDKMDHWNRSYGPKGLFQYQCVFPKECAEQALELLFQKIKKSRFKPYLAVIKIHGSIQSPGILSFPLEGFSIALDFKNEKGIVSFFRELDALTIQFHGRVYLAKDALLSKESFQKMYPQQVEFEEIKSKFGKGHFTSFLVKRLFLER